MSEVPARPAHQHARHGACCDLRLAERGHAHPPVVCVSPIVHAAARRSEIRQSIIVASSDLLIERLVELNYHTDDHRSRTIHLRQRRLRGG